MKLKKLLQKENLRPYLLKGRYGIEKESQRVTLAGQLADSDHPEILGNRSYHPYIQTDFSETQMELITPVADTIEELFCYLEAIQEVAFRSLPKEEMLWPLSMPPALPEDETKIKIAKLKNLEDVLYRRFLAKNYGRRKQMVSGIHFNFEFEDELLQKLFLQQADWEDYQEFKTEVYLKVTRNYLHYRWLITYLFGASPQSEARYFLDEDQPKQPIRSIRSSKYGYTNHKDIHVSYESLPKYLGDIAKLVESGKLLEEKEFYAPVRLRGGSQVADLAEAGIRYIELRNIDLNPFAQEGITREQVLFLHVFLLFLLTKEEQAPADEWVAQGDELNNQVALEHPLAKTAYQNAAKELLAEISAFAKELHLPLDETLFASLLDTVEQPEKTLAGRLYLQSQQSTQAQVAVALGQKYHQKAWAVPYQLAGFRDMELSTQLLIFDAIQKGIKVEILDKTDQFIKLTFKQHVEYVKNANMTSKDNYVVPLMMENKTVTKKILAQAGFRVPQGLEFSAVQDALQAYPEFSQKAFVVKPKSTNYGLGISIFKEGASLADYQEAVEIAFKEDTSILIEEFLEGTEYRFFVLDGKVRAIMLRVPANVVGDGKHTIEELVAQKNIDPLRGTHHRTPLEFISLGDLEKLMLKEQGYQTTSVPEEGVVVYLRENSNISTGGDSLDVTDEFSEDYKKVAEQAVAALGAKISGIDLIIPDKTVAASFPNAYGIIEANFNPAMHMHAYPFSGQGRRLTMDVLSFLFPELAE